MEKESDKESDDDIDFSWLKGIFRKSPENEKKEDSSQHIPAESKPVESKAHKPASVEEKTTHAKKASEEESDETGHEIDWQNVRSSIKNAWHNSKKLFSQPEDDDDISVDWKKLSVFFKKYSTLLLILIPLILSIYLRVLPAYLPITDEWAASSVNNYFNSQIQGQIDSQYPNLPDANKQLLVNDELAKFKKNNKDAYEQQIKGTSEFFKQSLEDEDGHTYLGDIDTWFWHRHARNVILNGYPGDEIRNGIEWDNKMLAPLGREVPPDKFHAYFIAYIYKFLKVFNRGLQLHRVTFFISVLISTLAVIPAFFLARRFGGNFGGLIAGIIAAVHPMAMSRTTAGIADTDAYNVTFPLYIAWVFLEAFESKDRKRMIILSILASFLTGIYAFTWSGWWHIFDFLILATLAYLAYFFISNRDSLKENFTSLLAHPNFTNTMLMFVIFLVGSGVFVSMFTNYPTFTSGFYSPIGFTQIKSVGISSAWPNVFTTVAEQNETDVPGMINQIGGKLLFFIALLGTFMTLWSNKGNKLYEILFLCAAALFYLIGINYFTYDIKVFVAIICLPLAAKLLWALYNKDTSIDLRYSIILIMWIVATTYAATKGVRWILLEVPPFSIASGIAFGYAFKKGIYYFNKEFHIHKLISGIVLAVLLLLLIGISPIPPFCSSGFCGSAAYVAKHEVPLINDAWYLPLEKINNEAAPDAIITSWWDFGHWFKTVAQRGVTFDGTSQNTPMAHFVGNALLTDDEQRAVGTIRMLDCGSDTAIAVLEQELNKTYKAVELLRKVFPLSRDEAKKAYKEYGLSDEKIAALINLTHCTPPEAYFITSDDMIGKSGVWSHFGIWDFIKATKYNQVYGAAKDNGIKYLMDEFNMSKDDAQPLYFEIQTVDPNKESNSWISPWPSYASGVDGCSPEDADSKILKCANNFKIDLDKRSAEISTPDGIKHPKKLSIITKEGLFVREYGENYITMNNGRPLGLAVFPSNPEASSYSTLFMDAELTASMFTRLYYMSGHGLKCFEKFADERSNLGTHVIVWKVDWECKHNLYYYFNGNSSAEPNS